MLGRISKLFLVALLIIVPISVEAALVNINTAPAEELETLNGIGPSYAQRIIDYRTLNGPFQKIEDIKNVKGIGDATYEKIKGFITVGDAPAPSDTGSSTSTSTEVIAEVSSGNASVASASEAPSAHYGASSLSTEKIPMKISVDAGRDRLGSVGSPLEFVGETELPYTRYDNFVWSFGDGNVGYGRVLTHIYEYSGEYVVVLNFSTESGKAISRINVKIVNPEIEIVFASPERVELKNNSQVEASLYGKSIWSRGETFVFPKDTIIKSGQRISFGSNLTGLRPLNIDDVQLFGAYNIEKQVGDRIAYFKKELIAKREELANMTAISSSLNKEEATSSVEMRKNSEVKEASVRTGWLALLRRFFLRE